MKKNNGFTLIELMIAIGLFAFFMLIAINAFSFISNTQKNNLDTQKFYTGIYNIIDSIKTDVRGGYIDYEHYKSFDYDIDTPENELALIYNNDDTVLYKIGDESCYPGITSCVEKSLDDGVTWVNITPKNLLVKKMDFYISPKSDTFQPTPMDWSDCKYFNFFNTCLCLTDYGCYADQTCEYFTCHNPRKMGFVTLVLSGDYIVNNKTIENFNYQTSMEFKKYLQK